MITTISKLLPLRARPPQNRADSIRPAVSAERAAALSLLFRDCSRRTREALFRWVRQVYQNNRAAFQGLLIAEHDGQIRGTIWGQPVPGRQTAIWLPVLAEGEPQQTCGRLIQALDEQMAVWPRHVASVSVKLNQLQVVAAIAACNFRYITDLARMVCPVKGIPDRSLSADLEFACCKLTDLERLQRLIPQTYEDSLDCPAMRGIRRIDDVLSGHAEKAHGEPVLWRIVRHHQQDVGCLLLTRHDELPECEVSYLGLVPDARGRGWGSILIRKAQQLARSADVERLFLSCDVSNPPALKTYQRAGFREVNRSAVFVKSYGDETGR